METKMRLLLVICLLFTSSVSADYDSNFKGKVLEVLTYTTSSLILFKVESQPSSHPLCTKFDYIAIAPETAPELKQIVYSRLLAAYAADEVVNNGHDGKDECVGARMKVYRVG